MTRFRKSIVFAGIALLIFSFARLHLLLIYPEAFSELNLPLKALAFLNGMRFDLSILLSTVQVTGDLIHENRWAPPYPGRP